MGIELATYAWVIPGSVVGVTLAVAAWRWGATLPSPVRRRLVAAFVAYLGAAIGVEGVNGWLVRQDAEYPYVLGTLVEESIEMAACIVALTGLAKLVDVSDGAIRRHTPSSSSAHGVRRQGGRTTTSA